MSALGNELKLWGISCLFGCALFSCQGDDNYSVKDAGDTDACQHSCVADNTACVAPGLIVAGTCPDEGICCDPDGQSQDTDTGTDTGTEGDTYEAGPCQYQCLDFMSCPMKATVEVQECEDVGQVCCNLQQ